jgi:acyl-CoA synthetase (AMP-forming)/AMP-acid ligase II
MACLLVYTSGSTGAPKGALLHHDGVVRFASTQNALWPVRRFRVLNYFPINHIGCLVDVGACALAAGGAMIFMEQFDPERSLALMEQEAVSIWGSVPSVFQMQLRSQRFAITDFSAVELIMWGGAAMPEALIAQLLKLGVPLATNYGMTETSSAITALGPTRDAEALSASVGAPFPGVDVRLVDDSGAEPAPGEPGEVRARSALNFLSYWRNDEATRAAFDADGYFRTGDLAVRRSDGGLRIVGRIKEMYKSGGYNVYPLEVEAVLERHPGVAIAAVVGVPDPLWQEIGVAFVVPSGPLSVEDLQSWCRAHLANYKAPKRFAIRSDLPFLPIGKIDKARLRAEAAVLNT